MVAALPPGVLGGSVKAPKRVCVMSTFPLGGHPTTENPVLHRLSYPGLSAYKVVVRDMETASLNSGIDTFYIP